MNTQHITAILAVTSLTFSAGAMAQNMSESEYKAAEKVIVADYKSAQASCNPFAANAKDLCLAEARRTEKIAKAELEARFKPSFNAGHDGSVDRARVD